MPKIMLQFQNGDTSWHQGDSAGIFMYSAGIFETFVKKILCPRASPMCTGNWEVLFCEENGEFETLEENDVQFMIEELCTN